jgi:hypothetical protein
MEGKICPRCNIFKSLDNYHKDRTHKNGYVSHCKDCIKKYKKINPETRRRWLSKKDSYHVWSGMKARCNNPKHCGYSYYGGRGITYCKEWESYKNFLRDMGPRPPGTSIDRIDPDGNYEPSNCRWAIKTLQAYNKRKYAPRKWKPKQKNYVC